MSLTDFRVTDDACKFLRPNEVRLEGKVSTGKHDVSCVRDVIEMTIVVLYSGKCTVEDGYVETFISNVRWRNLITFVPCTGSTALCTESRWSPLILNG